jgi:hypothetical protein
VRIEESKKFNELSEKMLLEHSERMARADQDKRDIQARHEKEIKAHLQHYQSLQDKYDQLHVKNAEILEENVRQLGVAEELRGRIEQKHIELLGLRD